jgi:heme/copper-type cytochrome/quinol oxidase subunit 3
MRATAVQEDLVPTGIPGELLPSEVTGPVSFGWWGMWGLISTEAILFASLIASYFYLRFQSPSGWPPPGFRAPDLALPLVMTVILWSSSLPVHLADRAIKRGSQGGLRLWLLLGFLLGATFLVLELGKDWPDTLHRFFRPTDNAYASMYFTLTGFHGFHVLVGLLFSLWTQLRAWQGAFNERRHLTVQNFTMYWHFVDVVWLFVLLTVYVSPRR